MEGELDIIKLVFDNIGSKKKLDESTTWWEIFGLFSENGEETFEYLNDFTCPILCQIVPLPDNVFILCLCFAS